MIPFRLCALSLLLLSGCSDRVPQVAPRAATRPPTQQKLTKPSEADLARLAQQEAKDRGRTPGERYAGGGQ